VPEPVVETPEPVAPPFPEPVAPPVPEPVAPPVPEPVAPPVPIVETPEPVCIPLCILIVEPAAEVMSVAAPVPETHEHVIELADYTTPEYMDMVKKLIEKPKPQPEVEIEINNPSRKIFKIPGYKSIQMSNASKQTRRKMMSFG
jgi:protein TonB